MQKTKVTGFTLIECIVALFVTAMVAVMIQFACQVYEKTNHQNFDDTTEWFLFIRNLESASLKFELIQGTGKTDSFNNLHDKSGTVMKVHSTPLIKDYQMYFNRGEHVIKFWGLESGRGYLPLLNHVKGLDVQALDSTHVRMHVEFLSGEQHTAVVQLLPDSKELK